jgi:hypothetical protein
MPSPFPGMNPYLEHEFVWKDFHVTCIPVVREMLADRLGDAYSVMVGEHLYIHEPSAEERRLVGHADASVARAAAVPGTGGNGTVASVAPVRATFPLPVDFETVPTVEVRDREGNRIITVIEILSPSNKRSGDDRQQYLRKRGELMRSESHLVEIDLLRGGRRLPVSGLPECDYYAAVSRVGERPEVDVWPVKLRERLPEISIPLADPDPDVPLDLKAMLDLVYDRSRYGPRLYRRPIQPPLEPDDAEWAKQFVPAEAAR